jgi:hypothetical protein
MVQNIIWKADSHSAYQKLSCFLYGTHRNNYYCDLSLIDDDDDDDDDDL